MRDCEMQKNNDTLFLKKDVILKTENQNDNLNFILVMCFYVVTFL